MWNSPIEIMACDAQLKGMVFNDEFVYSGSWVASTPTELGSLATIDVQLQINSDSDFIVQEQNIQAYDNNNAAIATPNYLLTIVRAGSGREIMNAPQHVTNILGNHFSNNYPGKKPAAGLWQSNNTITLRLQNLTTVVPKRVDLAFVGFKVFYMGAYTRRDVFGQYL